MTGAGRLRNHFVTRVADLAAGLGATEGLVLGTSRILASTEEKRRTWQETGALAVDLESDVVARIAAASGIPFLVVRTIADQRLSSIAAGGADPTRQKRHAKASPRSGFRASPAAAIRRVVRIGARNASRACSASPARPRPAWPCRRGLTEPTLPRHVLRARIRPAVAGRAGSPAPSRLRCARRATPP